MLVYKTKGVCSQEIRFELDGDKIKHVEFIGGCSGNTQGCLLYTSDAADE